MLDRMEEVFRRLAIMPYVMALGFLVFLILFDFQEDSLSESIVLVGFLISAIALFSILLLGWKPGVAYPYPNYRRKAIILWVYGIPLTALIAVFNWQHGPPFWLQVIVYFLTFFLITTMTFGILPGYGGAYKEYWDLERRVGKVRGATGKIQAIHINRDRTIKSVSEVCETCLTAVLSDDVRCWRCGGVIRWEEEFRRRWMRDPRSRWEKKKEGDHAFWMRTWHPDYVRRNGQGIPDRSYRVPQLFAYVYTDSRWVLFAIVDTIPQTTLDPILLAKGRRRSPRDARKSVERELKDVDFESMAPG